MGTGTLALPFAACQAGMICNALGMALVTVWNIYAVDRLLRCFEYIQEEEKVHSRFEHLSQDTFNEEASDNQSSEEIGDSHQPLNALSQISKEAFGNIGVRIVDTCLLILMIAIIIAYQGKICHVFTLYQPFTIPAQRTYKYVSLAAALLGFMGVSEKMSSKYIGSLLLQLIILPLATISNFKVVSSVSAMGIFILVIVFASVGCYGIIQNGLNGFRLSYITKEHMWPATSTALSHWFGVVACK
jgi:amino acid permease